MGGHVSWGGEQFAGTSESNSALFTAATDVPDSFIASKYMVIFSKAERRQGTKEGISILWDAMCANKHPFTVHQIIRGGDRGWKYQSRYVHPGRVRDELVQGRKTR